MKFSLDVYPSASWGLVLFVLKNEKWIIGFDWYFWTKTRRRCESEMWLTLASTNNEKPDFVVSGMKTNKHRKLCPFWWKRKTNPSSHELLRPKFWIQFKSYRANVIHFVTRKSSPSNLLLPQNKLILINNNFTKCIYKTPMLKWNEQKHKQIEFTRWIIFPNWI